MWLFNSTLKKYYGSRIIAEYIHKLTYNSVWNSGLQQSTNYKVCGFTPFSLTFYNISCSHHK